MTLEKRRRCGLSRHAEVAKDAPHQPADPCGPDNHIWNGDVVELHLDTRRPDMLGTAADAPGTLANRMRGIDNENRNGIEAGF
jgi:hypothetical protein